MRIDKCHFCGDKLDSKFAPHALAWDWFTGYLADTVHICPNCRKIRAHVEEFEMLFRESRIPPTKEGKAI